VILIRIQHWPSRPQGLQRLLERVPSAEVISDDEPGQSNPWRGYRKCLANLPASGHVVVLQDDTVPCINFELGLERLVVARPSDVVSLFVGGLNSVTRRNCFEALRQGRHWALLHPRDIAHVVGLIWPVDQARDFLTWTETAKIPGHGLRMPRSDDAIVGSWARQTKTPIWIALPNLVQHPDDLVSTIGRRHYDGKEKGRVSVAFIADGDPLEIDWQT
jgi:hypothetical protein